MANSEHLRILEQGVEVWNRWRKENPLITPDLRGAILRDRDLEGIDLSRGEWASVLIDADLGHANLSNANLQGACLNLGQLTGTKLIRANLRGAELLGTILHFADLSEADCRECNFSSANLDNAKLINTRLGQAMLWYATLRGADLTGANLTNAELFTANLTGAHVENAIFTHCKVFGISAWALEGTPKSQDGLEINQVTESTITVDNLEIAQFIYLLLKNEKIRGIIDAVTSKVVLILGRFSEERKPVLDAIRQELRQRNFAPVLFDFDKPGSKDITGTVETLARMARFIIADLTDPSSIPHELATIVPFLRTTPVLPLRLAGSKGYSMFEDLQSYPWVLDVYEYTDGASLISSLSEVIAPADQMAEQLRRTL